jgi:hypothetical protein
VALATRHELRTPALDVRPQRAASPPIDDWSTDRTLELCGKKSNGRRCMQRKGHTGPHECLTLSGTQSWE